MATHKLVALPVAPGLRSSPVGMASPKQAHRMIEQQTGSRIAKSTFYRWLAEGLIFSVQPRWRHFIPMFEVERVVKQIRRGERL